MTRILYAIGGIAIGLAVMFCAVCAAHADSTSTVSVSITVVDAITYDGKTLEDGSSVPVPSNDGSINYDRPTR